MKNKVVHIIEAPSALGHRTNIMGSGDTEAAAWSDAYGPKPWSLYTKRSAKAAWHRKVTSKDLERILGE